jgi:hypothetical protein
MLYLLKHILKPPLMRDFPRQTVSHNQRVLTIPSREILFSKRDDGTMDSGLYGSKKAIFLGKFHHDLTVLPHWKSWFMLGKSSPNGLNSCWWNIIIYPYIFNEEDDNESLECGLWNNMKYMKSCIDKDVSTENRIRATIVWGDSGIWSWILH